MKNFIKNAALATTFGLGVLALSNSTASAAIVCNGDGDCWHVHDQYSYPDNSGVIVHNDDWRWNDTDHDRYRWREHEGRGYWHGGVWIGF